MVNVPTLAPDVYFAIEITSREYGGHLLLAAELAARGRVVVIGHKGAVMRAVGRARRPGLLFYKNARKPPWESRVDHAFVGLDPEAGIVYDDFADFYANRSFFSPDSSSRAQFCFGPDDHDFLLDRFPEHHARYHLTGSPRVSLWGADGDRFYAADTAQIRDHYGDVLLFTSSGGFTHEHYLRRRGQDPQKAWDEADHAHHFLSRVLAATDATDLSVVVRPHPSDSWDAWNRAVAASPRLAVDTTFDLSAWTRAAVAVVQPGTSTAAFEAACAGVPAISTESTPQQANAATRISHRRDTVEGVLEAIFAARLGHLATLPDEQAARLLTRKLFHPLEGAAQRVADIIDEVAPFDGASGLPRTRLRGLLNRRSRAETPRLGRTSVPPFKRDRILAERVERDVEAARQILGRQHAIRVRQIDDDCFVLHG